MKYKTLFSKDIKETIGTIAREIKTAKKRIERADIAQSIIREALENLEVQGVTDNFTLPELAEMVRDKTRGFQREISILRDTLGKGTVGNAAELYNLKRENKLYCSVMQHIIDAADMNTAPEEMDAQEAEHNQRDVLEIDEPTELGMIISRFVNDQKREIGSNAAFDDCKRMANVLCNLIDRPDISNLECTPAAKLEHIVKAIEEQRTASNSESNTPAPIGKTLDCHEKEWSTLIEKQSDANRDDDGNPHDLTGSELAADLQIRVDMLGRHYEEIIAVAENCLLNTEQQHSAALMENGEIRRRACQVAQGFYIDDTLPTELIITRLAKMLHNAHYSADRLNEYATGKVSDVSDTIPEKLDGVYGAIKQLRRKCDKLKKIADGTIIDDCYKAAYGLLEAINRTDINDTTETTPEIILRATEAVREIIESRDSNAARHSALLVLHERQLAKKLEAKIKTLSQSVNHNAEEAFRALKERDQICADRNTKQKTIDALLDSLSAKQKTIESMARKATLIPVYICTADPDNIFRCTEEIREACESHQRGTCGNSRVKL